MAGLVLVFLPGLGRTAPPAGPATGQVERQGRPEKRIQDPAVTPAGGAACQACRGGRCQHGQAGRHGHHEGCREGRCVPYCPVRPQQYGFYGTQWRKWPGQDVVPVSDERAATPSLPPRLVVPRPNEESSRTGLDDGAMPDDGAEASGAGLPDVFPPALERQPAKPAPVSPGPREPEVPTGREPAVNPPSPEPSAPGPEPIVPVVPETEQPEPAVPEPSPSPEPMEPELKPEPRPAPKAPPADDFESLFRELPVRPAEPPKPVEPPKAPVPTKPEDENLFEAGPGSRVPRKFIAGGAVRAGIDPATGAIRPATHAAPAEPRAVPRVPFDPAAESRRLRSGR
jgi:hypothetical protein